MKRLKLIKVMASLLIMISALALKPTLADAKWKRDSKGWWNTEGSSWSIGWRQIDGKWYYFGQDGYMKTGWVEDNGKWYYLYSDGSMAHDTSINGYKLGLDGAWLEDTEDKNDNKGEAKEAFIMKTEKSVYELGTEKVKVYITNNTNEESGYGVAYEVEKFENNEWQHLDYTDDMMFIEIWVMLQAKETNEEVYSLSKNFKVGKYRIVKNIGGEKVTAEFEIQ